MVRIDPESSPSDSTLPAPEGSSLRSEPVPFKPSSGGLGRLLAFTILAGLMAGVISSVVGERIMDAYRGDLLPKLEVHPSPETMRRLRDARLYTATLTYAAMGGFLGLAMGLAGGLARRSVLAGVRAGAVGLVLGTVAVASASLPLASHFFKTRDPQSVRPGAPDAHAWCDLVGRWCDRRPRGRPGARRERPMESHSRGRARRCRRRGDHLRDCRRARLCDRQDGPPALGFDHDSMYGPVADRDPLGGGRGPRPGPVPEGRGSLVGSLVIRLNNYRN